MSRQGPRYLIPYGEDEQWNWLGLPPVYNPDLPTSLVRWGVTVPAASRTHEEGA
jgi:hypothetical protein